MTIKPAFKNPTILTEAPKSHRRRRLWRATGSIWAAGAAAWTKWDVYGFTGDIAIQLWLI